MRCFMEAVSSMAKIARSIWDRFGISTCHQVAIAEMIPKAGMFTTITGLMASLITIPIIKKDLSRYGLKCTVLSLP